MKNSKEFVDFMKSKQFFVKQSKHRLEFFYDKEKNIQLSKCDLIGHMIEFILYYNHNVYINTRNERNIDDIIKKLWRVITRIYKEVN